MWALVPLGEIFAKPFEFNIVDIAELKCCNILMLVKRDHGIFLYIGCPWVLGVTPEFLQNLWRCINGGSFGKLGF